MSKASKSGQVKASITTYDNGDDTITFTEIGGSIKVKRPGKAAEVIAFEAAVAEMTSLELARWGVTHQLKDVPAWAL